MPRGLRRIKREAQLPFAAHWSSAASRFCALDAGDVGSDASAPGGVRALVDRPLGAGEPALHLEVALLLLERGLHVPIAVGAGARLAAARGRQALPAPENAARSRTVVIVSHLTSRLGRNPRAIEAMNPD